MNESLRSGTLLSQASRRSGQLALWVKVESASLYWPRGENNQCVFTTSHIPMNQIQVMTVHTIYKHVSVELCCSVRTDRATVYGLTRLVKLFLRHKSYWKSIPTQIQGRSNQTLVYHNNPWNDWTFIWRTSNHWVTLFRHEIGTLLSFWGNRFYILSCKLYQIKRVTYYISLLLKTPIRQQM